jgi:hypothetical protein
MAILARSASQLASVEKGWAYTKKPRRRFSQTKGGGHMTLTDDKSQRSTGSTD